MRRLLSVSLGLVLALGCTSASAGVADVLPPSFPGPTTVPAASVPSGFVTRSGTHLLLNRRPYAFAGVNIYNANSDGTNERGCWYSMQSGNSLDTALTTIAKGMGQGNKVFRAWFFQDLATNHGKRDWSYFDHTLAVARAHGFKVIATIGDQWGSCDHDGYKAASWYERGYRDPDPAGTVSYRAWAAEIASRYRNDPTILAWQLVNEGQVTIPGGACAPDAEGIFKAWATDVSGVIKAADPHHLVSIGTIGNGNCGAANGEYQDLHGIPTVDLCEYHDYGGGRAPIPGDRWNGMQVRLDQCKALGKPLLVGELGIGRTEVGTLSDRARALKAKLQAQRNAGVAGFVAWDWWNGSSPGGDGYQIGPGDPSLPVLGAYSR